MTPQLSRNSSIALKCDRFFHHFHFLQNRVLSDVWDPSHQLPTHHDQAKSNSDRNIVCGKSILFTCLSKLSADPDQTIKHRRWGRNAHRSAATKTSPLGMNSMTSAFYANCLRLMPVP